MSNRIIRGIGRIGCAKLFNMENDLWWEFGQHMHSRFVWVSSYDGVQNTMLVIKSTVNDFVMEQLNEFNTSAYRTSYDLARFRGAS